MWISLVDYPIVSHPNCAKSNQPINRNVPPKTKAALICPKYAKMELTTDDTALKLHAHVWLKTCTLCFFILQTKIVNVPKCCPLEEVLIPNGCAKLDYSFAPSIKVHENNSTHLDDEPMVNVTIEFQPFPESISCENGQWVFALICKG